MATVRTVDLAPFETRVIPEEIGLLAREKVIAPVPVLVVAVMVSYAAAPLDVVTEDDVDVNAIRGFTVITTLKAVEEPKVSVAVTDSL